MLQAISRFNMQIFFDSKAKKNNQQTKKVACFGEQVKAGQNSTNKKVSQGRPYVQYFGVAPQLNGNNLAMELREK